MGMLTNVFYLISTSLLIPVMLALLWCLVRVLLQAGRMLREYSARASVRDEIALFAKALERDAPVFPRPPKQGLVAEALSKLRAVSDNDVLAEKVVNDCQLVWQAEIEKFRSLVRLGPALGLMGTLIPLGPALVGLAAGDLQMMSQNLVIAFATTVVGLLVGTLATSLAGIKKRWHQADAVVVAFAANRLPQVDVYLDSDDEEAALDRHEGNGSQDAESSCEGACCGCAKEPTHA